LLAERAYLQDKRRENVFAARRLAARLGPQQRVATILVDTGLKYLAGDLFDDQKPIMVPRRDVRQ
jgi:hypothetical protein